MSITNETAKHHAKDPAVACCRFEAGNIVEASNLEDPAIFDDLIDSGLLKIPADCFTIEQVIGAKCIKTIDALMPMTAEYIEPVGGAAKAAEAAPAIEPVAVESTPAPAAQMMPMAGSPGTIKIHIGEGKDINLEIPMYGGSGIPYPASPQEVPSSVEAAGNLASAVSDHVSQTGTQIIRSVKRKYFKIDKIAFGEETKIEGTTLTLRNADALCKDALATEHLVTDVKLEIITPDKYDTYSETIMDVQPIAVKEEGELGTGITRVIDGCVFVLTGTDENGVQIGEFGSSEGELSKNIMWGRPGAPDKGDILIKAQVTIEAGTNMERPGPLAAHKAADHITEEIRKALKAADASLCVKEEEFVQTRRHGNKKILIVKEIMGQGAMHDNLILPVEPVGTLGGKPNVDLGNLPIMLSPTEILDGGIHALTCIGPASKECSRHYFREPLVMAAMADEEIDLLGVVLIGSPQINAEKFYVSKRLGMMIEAMDLDGAIVTTEGFGNNHIDFASHIEQIGMRGVKVVGVSFSAVQGALVVGNKYMNCMVDNNKSKQGIENEILCNNTLCEEDAVRALAMLKASICEEEVTPAERKWNGNVRLNNLDIIEKQTGITLTRVENEQVLPKSKKRAEIYETE